MKYGIVVDIRNYKDYVKRFKPQYLEFHLLQSDLELFLKSVHQLQLFFMKNRFKRIAFHMPDNLIQTILFYTPTYNDLKLFIETMSAIDKIGCLLNQEIYIVIHFSVKLSKHSKDIQKERIRILTSASLKYKQLINYTKKSHIRILPENSPPFCGSNPDMIHINDVAFEDIKNRVNKGMVLDISHLVIAINHNINTQFVSLSSIESFIKMSGHYIKWIHLSDSDGNIEGLSLGCGTINFKQLFRIINKYVKDPIYILELVGAEKDLKLIQKSLCQIKLLQ